MTFGLDPDKISARFSPSIIGREIQVYRETASTNDVAMRLGRAGMAEGVVIFAESQTAGRGRLGRHWKSAAGLGLWFSVLLRPRWADFSHLSLAAAVAVARGIDPFLPERARIKWPNDIYLGEDRKTAGILCESSRDFAIVGVGLNVNHSWNDFDGEIADRATSLALVSGQHFDRNEVAASVLAEFDRIYQTLPNGFEAVVSECTERSVLLHRFVRIQSGGFSASGMVTGIDRDGGLRLRLENGFEKIVTSGEVVAMEML